MTDKSEAYRTHSQRIRAASEVPHVLEVLKALRVSHESGELSAKERYELQVPAFHALRRLSADSPVDAGRLILEYLLPECLQINPDAAIELHHHRECLVDWLNQYPDETARDELRDRVLESVYPRLAAGDPSAACSVISQIGYRTDRAVELLRRIGTQRDDQKGDAALATLTNLGVPPPEREAILAELHNRATTRYNRWLVWALVGLADPSSISVVQHSWLLSTERILDSLDRSLVFNLFRAVLDVGSDDAALQDRVWRLLAGLVRRAPDELSHEFHLGQTAPVCNSTLVAPTMLEWLTQVPAEENKPAWRRYLVGLRLEECVRPRQLQGWAGLGGARGAFEVLRQDACYNTDHDGFWTTAEDTGKKQAWRTLLRAGFADALDWFDQAVVSEKGRFMQQSVIELFSLFRIDPLPKIIVHWITEEVEHVAGGTDSREFMRRMAATRMARSSASREAFDALLNFGFTSEGRPMMPSVLALAEVAAHLVRSGDRSVADRLVDAAVSGHKPHQRVAAARAIERIASGSPSLLLPHVEKLVPAVYDTEREAVERGTLIEALGCLEGWRFPNSLLKDMKRWARRSDRWIGGGSLTALARHGYLRNDPALLTEVLGLRLLGDAWDVAEHAAPFAWAPYTVGMLYHREPETFAPAIASLLRDLDWLSVPQVLGWLVRAHGRPGQSEPPKAVKEALTQRIRAKQGRAYAEADIFGVLARVAPDQLAEEEWRNQWHDWLPDSRVALADALGAAVLNSDLQPHAVSQLTLLAQDAQYAVRRAAYRGIAQQSSDALHGLCVSWSDASSVGLRQRAAEACAWLRSPRAGDSPQALEKLYQQLATDRDKSVREAATRGWKERRDRVWARQYLSVVTNIKGQSNRDILDAWRYGDALARIGDDSTMDALREHLVKNEDWHPPNLRYWIEQIIKDLEHNWRKTTRDWPDPWFAWGGAIQQGRGRIYLPRGVPIDIEYSIWSQPRAAPSQPPQFEWGGAVWPVPLAVQDRDQIAIELEDGAKGSIMVSRVDGNTWMFLGSGPFPE